MDGWMDGSMGKLIDRSIDALLARTHARTRTLARHAPFGRRGALIRETYHETYQLVRMSRAAAP